MKSGPSCQNLTGPELQQIAEKAEFLARHQTTRAIGDPTQLKMSPCRLIPVVVFENLDRIFHNPSR
jgi:hypothetical protein